MDELTQYLNARVETIKKNLQSEIKVILMDVGTQAVKKINQYIENWYKEYTPVDYQRTYQLRDCARYSIEGNKVRIYMDMRRIRASAENGGEGWQAHRGFDGEDFTYGLIDFLEGNNASGNKGVKSNPRRNDFGIHFLGDTQAWVNEYVDKQVQVRIQALVRGASQ